MKSNLRASFIQPEDELDRIYKAWLADKLDDLSLRDKWLLERMEYANKLLREGGKRSMYKNMVKDMLQYFKHHDVTSRTIDNDIARAKRFFLVAQPREDKEFAKGVHIEWLKRFIWKAEKKGDMKAVAMLMREKAEVEALKKDDIELPDYDKLQRQPILIITDLADINMPVIPNLEEELKKLRMSKSEYLKANSEDIDYEEVDGE